MPDAVKQFAETGFVRQVIQQFLLRSLFDVIHHAPIMTGANDLNGQHLQRRGARATLDHQVSLILRSIQLKPDAAPVCLPGFRHMLLDFFDQVPDDELKQYAPLLKVFSVSFLWTGTAGFGAADAERP